MTTLVLTAVVILLALGYRFDKDALLVREGLLQLGSHPDDVNYTIDGKEYKDLTPAKLTLPSGNYDVKLSREGYRPWERTVNIIAGHVHWINYPRLIPETLSPSSVKDYAKVLFAKTSPDKRWLLLNPGNEPNQLELVDLKDPKKPEFITLTIPDNQLTKKDGKLGELQFAEWSLDSKQFLLKHVNADTSEYLKVDRGKPNEAININERFQLAIDDAHFSGGDTNVVYARTKDTLRRFDIAGNTTSGSLMNGMVQFEMYGDSTVVFDRVVDQQVADQQSHKTQEVGIRVKDKDVVFEELPAGDDVTVSFKEFDGHTYFVIANRTTQSVKMYRDPEDPANRNTVFAEFANLAPQYVRFNGNGRFLLLQQGNRFGVYDFYEQQKFVYELPGGLPADQAAKWLDDFHIATNVQGKLHLWDFDGTNLQELVTAAPGLDPVLDEDDDILYTFEKATNDGKDQIRFMSTSMIVKK